MKQQALSMTGYFDKGKKTRRERFLAEMERVVPWGRLCALIEPHYSKGSASGGRPPLPLERMFRVYCLQQWYNLSDPGAEEALYDSITMRRFAGVRTDQDVIPDETSILNFRRLLEKHRLTERLLAEINAHLSERGCSWARARSWMPPSSTRPPRPRTPISGFPFGKAKVELRRFALPAATGYNASTEQGHSSPEVR